MSESPRTMLEGRRRLVGQGPGPEPKSEYSNLSRNLGLHYS